MKQIIGILLVLALVLSFSLVATTPVAAAIHYVNPGDSIQTAINAAASGDTIIVAAGTYTEYLVITTDSLTLQGAGIDQTIIDLAGLKPYWHYPGTSYASRGGVLISGYGSTGEIVENVTFRGFTVKNAGMNPPTPYTEFIDNGAGSDIVRGIAVHNGKNILIQNCKVENSGWYGIVVGKARGTTLTQSEGVTINNCIVIDNWETGIHVADYVGAITITYNECSRNKRPFTDGGRTFSGKGIEVNGKSTTERISGLIAHNKCFDNGYEGIRIADYSDGVVVEYNQVGGHNIDSSSSGIFLTAGGSDPTRCINNVIRYNDLDGDIRGIVAYYAQECTIEGNTITTDSGTFSSGQEAIRIDGGNNMLIKDNILTDCDGVGIGIKTTWNNVVGYDNIVTGNVITNAKWAGLLLWWGARDNTFTCNTATGTQMLTRGTDLTYGDGVLLPGYSDGAKPGTGNVFHQNLIYGNAGFGMNNEAATEVVDATYNWWGDSSGPEHASNLGATGDKVSNDVSFDPWIKWAVTAPSGPVSLSPSAGNVLGLTPVAPPSLPSVTFPHGMFSFQICCLTPGETVILTIVLPSAVPVGTVWWKYHNGRWYALPNLNDNGNNIMVIRLTDGGAGDSDGLKDGVITDPGGPGNPMTVGWETSPTNKAALLVPWTILLAAIAAGAVLLVWRRRRAQI